MNNHKEITASAHCQQYHPQRDQFEMVYMCLDDVISENHKARAVWDFVKKMDTDPCYRKIKTFVHSPGRPTTSPEVLFALWLYSIIDGNISARKIVELCQHHDAYKWIAGGVPINRTMVSNFRSADPEKFNELMTNSLAVMLNEGLLNVEDIAQDGTRVKASAGNNSYRREPTLLKFQEEAKVHIKALQEDLQRNPNGHSDKQKKAQLRIAMDRKSRIDKAIQTLKKCRNEKIENKKKMGTNLQQKKN